MRLLAATVLLCFFPVSLCEATDEYWLPSHPYETPLQIVSQLPAVNWSGEMPDWSWTHDTWTWNQLILVSEHHWMDIKDEMARLYTKVKVSRSMFDIHASPWYHVFHPTEQLIRFTHFNMAWQGSDTLFHETQVFYNNSDSFCHESWFEPMNWPSDFTFRTLIRLHGKTVQKNWMNYTAFVEMSPDPSNECMKSLQESMRKQVQKILKDLRDVVNFIGLSFWNRPLDPIWYIFPKSTASAPTTTTDVATTVLTTSPSPEPATTLITSPTTEPTTTPVADTTHVEEASAPVKSGGGAKIGALSGLIVVVAFFACFFIYKKFFAKKQEMESEENGTDADIGMIEIPSRSPSGTSCPEKNEDNEAMLVSKFPEEMA